MSGQILLVNVEIMIAIQLPKFAIDDVKVLVAEIRHDLIDVLLLLQQLNHVQQVRFAQLSGRDLARPAAVHVVEDARYHGVHVAGVKLCCLLQECQPRVRIDDILYQWGKVLRQNVRSRAIPPGHYEDKPGCRIVAE